jgi:Interferon-induced transmembrane protein
MSDYGSTPPPPPPPPPPPADGGYGTGGYGTGGYGAQGTPPPNYLVWAILTTVLCCPPVGIPSIVFSTQVNTKWAAGDVLGAQTASEKAKKFAIWAAVAGVVVTAIGVILLAATRGMSTAAGV